MLLQRNVGLAFLCVTTNVYISYRDLLHNVYRGLQEEMCKLARFRKATQHELATLEDVCAVCLLPMRSARVTPCKHIFHGGCLLPCLKQKRTCPLCNQQIC
ncbi:PREDICTED: E3 ubiquitin-protein ligase AMFR-like [Priapulus caudatus]|uniref:E3 ubiquitin-protein ligase AMFR-like n=1 Tax=Priapulus caudatus TaxID=37621 RepID=A0ABM1EJ34_PRICU|nr:PREDICTED: E3 ubiquitin-protein ligase AMFR-like [Priapulus caudatus]